MYNPVGIFYSLASEFIHWNKIAEQRHNPRGVFYSVVIQKPAHKPDDILSYDYF
jgi:hypothetical protein